MKPKWTAVATWVFVGLNGVVLMIDIGAIWPAIGGGVGRTSLTTPLSNFRDFSSALSVPISLPRTNSLTF